MPRPFTTSEDATRCEVKSTRGEFSDPAKRQREQREVWDTPHNRKLGALIEALGDIREQIADLLRDRPQTVVRFEEHIPEYALRLHALEINLEGFLSVVETNRIEPRGSDLTPG